MIKKRYLMILSVTVVSILLGSLFYINMTLALKGQEPTIHKDSVEIIVLEWSSRQYPDGTYPQDYGVALTVDSPIALPFSFCPKEAFQNVTDLWITFTAQNMAPSSYWLTVNVTINDGTTVQTINFYPARNIGLKVVSVPISTQNIYETITSGINKLAITVPNDVLNVLTIFKVTVFIEYEFQA